MTGDDFADAIGKDVGRLVFRVAVGSFVAGIVVTGIIWIVSAHVSIGIH